MPTPLVFPGTNETLEGSPQNVLGVAVTTGAAIIEVTITGTFTSSGVTRDLALLSSDGDYVYFDYNPPLPDSVAEPAEGEVWRLRAPKADTWRIVGAYGEGSYVGDLAGEGSFRILYPTGPHHPLAFPGVDDTAGTGLQNLLASINDPDPIVFVTLTEPMATTYLGVYGVVNGDEYYNDEGMPAATYPFAIDPAESLSKVYGYTDNTYDPDLSSVGYYQLGGEEADAEVPPSRLVFVAYPNPLLGETEPLGELTHAEGKTIRRVYQAPGEGRFSINRHSDQAAWCVQGNYIRVYRDTTDGDPVFGFFIETSQDVVVSPDEEGGEFLTLGGRGQMSIFGNFVLQNVTALPNGEDLGALPQDDPDGMWHWTRNAGSIMRRQLEEMTARDVNPMATYDFDRDVDSNGDVWASDPDPPKFKLAVGISGLDMLGQLQQQGLIVYVTPDFVIHAWDTDQGLHTGLTFVRGVNIRDSAEREIEASGAVSHMLVQGDAAKGRKYRLRSDGGIAAAIGKKEGFLEFGATPTTATLDRAGDRAIAQLKRKHDGPTTIAIVEEEGAVALVDFVPGDYASVDIPGIWDDVESVIGEVILTESETGEIEASIQFGGDDPVFSADTPVGSGCDGCIGMCSRSESFFEPGDNITLAEAFMPGSTGVTRQPASDPAETWVRGSDYSEEPPTGILLQTGQSAGDTFVVTYQSAACMRQHMGIGSAAGADSGDFMEAFTFVDGEVPSGTINGSNTAFTLAHNPNPDSSLHLVKNGLRLRLTTDYTLSGTTITYVVAPTGGDWHLADYRY